MARRGYWGDIVSSPYLSFGLESPNKELFNKQNRQHVKVSAFIILTGHNFCFICPIEFCFLIFWKPRKYSIRWYVQLKCFETAHFRQFYPLIAHGFGPKMGRTWTLIFLYHMKEGFSGFHKIIKSLNLGHPNQSYSDSKVEKMSFLHVWYPLHMCYLAVQKSSLPIKVHPGRYAYARSYIVWLCSTPYLCRLLSPGNTQEVNLTLSYNKNSKLLIGERLSYCKDVVWSII